LQSTRKDILYVEDGELSIAKDLDDLVGQGFPLGTFDSDGGSPGPVLMVWMVSRKIPEGLGEWWFFREDVVKALTGQ
jgi:hypothetical protein